MRVPGRKVFGQKSQRQGTEAGVSLVYSKNSKKIPGSMDAVSETRQEMRTEVGQATAWKLL